MPTGMFSDEFRERLRIGKYSRWAVDLTEQQLEAVIWMIGEYGSRASDVLPRLTELWKSEGSGRAVLALESLFRVVGGDRPDRSESSSRVNAFLAEVRGYAEDSEDQRSREWPLDWRGQTVGWVRAPLLDDYGNCSGVWRADPIKGSDFLAQVRKSPPEETEVRIGGIFGWVRSPPDDSGCIAFWLHVSPHNNPS